MSTQIPPPLDPRQGRLTCNVYEVNSRTGLCRWCDGTVEAHGSDTFEDTNPVRAPGQKAQLPKDA